MDIPITGCEYAHAYRRAPARRVLLFAAVATMYALVAYMCFTTAGLPRASALDRVFSSHKYGDSWEEWQPDEESAVSNSSATLSLWGLRAREDALMRRESADQREYFLFSTRYSVLVFDSWATSLIFSCPLTCLTITRIVPGALMTDWPLWPTGSSASLCGKSCGRAVAAPFRLPTCPRPFRAWPFSLP
jgi:hypothetical protein